MLTTTYIRNRKHFLDLGADITIENANGRTPLLVAACVGSDAIIDMILASRDNVDLEAKDEMGDTALTLAAYFAHAIAVRLLVHGGASITAKDNDENNALHNAVKKDALEIVRFLLDQGAAIDARNAKQQTPLLVAVREGHIRIVRLLEQKHADLEAIDHLGNGVLHTAVLSDNKAMVHFCLRLRRHYYNLEGRTACGQTPLSRAAEQGYHGIAALLIAHGADLETQADMQGRKQWRPLHWAAGNGHAAVVELLLSKGADPRAEDMYAKTAQYYAEKEGHMAIATFIKDRTPINGDKKAAAATTLLSTDWGVTHFILWCRRGYLDLAKTELDKGGIDVTCMDRDGQRAITAAAEAGHDTIVEFLIERGADVNLPDDQGHSALWWASRQGHEAVVERLLRAQNASPDSPDRDGQTTLSAAAQGGFEGIVKTLLEKGCDVNAATRYGKTPLMFAAAQGHFAVVDQLLDAGADLRRKSCKGETAVSLALARGDKAVVARLEQDSMRMLKAARRGQVPAILRLVRKGISVSPGLLEEDANDPPSIPLIAAASNGHATAVRTLFQHGADLSHRDKNGQTALCHAAKHGETGTVRLLCELGAGVNTQDKDGRNPLSWAAESGEVGTVKVLLDFGSRKETKDKAGRTPLCHAVKNGFSDAVVALLDAGANINCRDAKGWSPLTIAVAINEGQLVSLLLQKGARMSVDVETNMSALCLAAAQGNLRIVELLIDHHAVIDHRSDDGETPLIKASRLGHVEIAQSLIEMGADTTLRDDHERTALSYAKENSHEGVLELLRRARSIRAENEWALGERQLESLVRRRHVRYTPLPKSYIRVLELRPGKSREVLSIDFAAVELSSKDVSFEALSYQWLEKEGSVRVHCGDDVVLVTPNCAAALRCLRSETETRILWIDAVCIDQSNKEEVNDQVAMMADIYRKAKQVVMWLGPIEGALRDYAKVFQAMNKSVETKKIINRSEAYGDILEEMYFASYFDRAWILQEIILAGDRGLVVWGRNTCPWKTFKKALLAYAKHEDVYNPSFAKIAKLDDKFTKHGAVALPEIMAALSKFEASEPRDKVFAALRLGSADMKTSSSSSSSRQQQQLAAPKADYTVAVHDVYIGAAGYYVDAMQVMPWGLGNRPSQKVVEGLPSWVPDFSIAAEESALADPFDDYEHVRFGELFDGQPTVKWSSIWVNGCILDEVFYSVSITKDTDLLNVLEDVAVALSNLGKGLYDTCEEPLIDDGIVEEIAGSHFEALLRALLADVPEGDVAKQRDDQEDVVTFLAYQLSIGETTPSVSKEVPEVLKERVEDWQDEAEHHRHFDLDVWEYIEDALRYDVDLVLTAKGHFGLVTKGEAEKGLRIALVGSANELCLLRIRADGEESWYEYVEDVYMAHLVDDLSLIVFRKDLQSQRLEIR